MRASRAIATMVATAVIATGALVALPSNAVADSGDSVSSSEIAAALGSTDASNGALVAEPLPSSTDTNSAAIVKQEDTTIEVPKDPEDGVSLQGEGAPEITIDLPNADASKDATRLKDGTVAYPGTNGSAQAVIPTDGGVQMLTTIANSSAPTRYDYKVDVPDGGRVEVSPDNSGAVVLDGDGKPVVLVPSPWAKDTSGTAIPTHFETDGTTLAQVVDHTGGSYDYPVVADPAWLAAIATAAGSMAAWCAANAAQDFATAGIKAALRRGDWRWNQRLWSAAESCAWGAVTGAGGWMLSWGARQYIVNTLKPYVYVVMRRVLKL